MITYLADAPNIKAKTAVEPTVEAAYSEVRQFLPELPVDMQVWLDNSYLIHETGEGGYSYAPNVISIAFDLAFKDKKAQRERLRATIFHEAFHLVQGHTFEKPKVIYKTALDAAIYEGCATVFEREYARSSPLWGNYEQHGEELLQRWRDGLFAVPAEVYYNDSAVYKKWVFYNEETGERWRLYKTGTWLVDQALKKSKLGILDLRLKNAEEIVGMIEV